ncbi:MAG: hypothetical protein R3C14_33745 [Caldilineaceae bacterium]
MKPMIREETWPYIAEYLRSVPEVLEKLPTFQEALDEREQRGEQRARQQTLLLLLEHKFGAIPAAIRSQIDHTTDLSQLDQWLLQVMDRDTLAAIDWELPSTD